jgi:uncharacterized Zn finger protein (UPF0148 family)
MNCPICGTALSHETTVCPTCGRGGLSSPPKSPGGTVRQLANQTLDASKKGAHDAVQLSRRAAGELLPAVEKATQDAAELSKRAYHEVRPTIEKVAHATEGAIHGAVRGAKEGAKKPTSHRPTADEASSESSEGP